jgi:hypothetical protein
MYNMTALLLKMHHKVPKKTKWPVTSGLEREKKPKLYYKRNTGHGLIAHSVRDQLIVAPRVIKPNLGLPWLSRGRKSFALIYQNFMVLRCCRIC